jgi:hypothetical protein
LLSLYHDKHVSKPDTATEYTVNHEKRPFATKTSDERKRPVVIIPALRKKLLAVSSLMP